MNLFSSITEESFSYLISDYGFSEPVATDGSWKTTFLYVNDQIGIEIELNYRDMDTFIFISKLKNGEFPQNDNYVRKQLEEIIEVEPSRSNGDSTTIEQFEKGIARKSTLLKNNIGEILNTSENVFV
ncbi:hypothetical protein [Fictibacillus arsenicus]|uniref:DUF1828 domain-containing protein n=1 Tax=Fictibacillus arsenicus TaxID=255247 RepID=A0A1V3GCK8_9BACL|nr:hypothetical protein [Fictibacillus arsenicus]OOE14606.1 hypothetical protein UN64_05300 [Fictibacillus arsenicus]